LRFFILVMETVTLAQVPLLGDVPSVTVATVLVTLQDGLTEHRTCAVEVDARLAETHFPDAFIDALPVLEYPLSDSKALSLELPRVEVGASDSDGDGHDGVTVFLEIPVLGPVEMHVHQISRVALDGYQTSPGVWEGTTTLTEFEQNVLWADHPLLRDPPSVSPSTGRFRMVEQPGPISCEDVTG